MKLKKTITSKLFIAGALVVLCVGILAVCLIPSGNGQTEFVPETTPAAAPAESWNENTATKEIPDTTVTVSPVSPSKAVAKENTKKNTKEDTKTDYPKTVESDKDQTVVEFTDPSPKKPEAPPVPEGKIEITDPEPTHLVQKEMTMTPTPTKQEVKKEAKQDTEKENKSKSTTPAPGEKNHNGQVYDEVFGWITIEEGVGIPTDNDGDINKQIGNMD